MKVAPKHLDQEAFIEVTVIMMNERLEAKAAGFHLHSRWFYCMGYNNCVAVKNYYAIKSNLLGSHQIRGFFVLPAINTIFI